MPDYKTMYELLYRSTTKALVLLREEKLTELLTAIDLLQDAQRTAEHLYTESDNTVPYLTAWDKSKQLTLNEQSEDG